MTTTVTGYVPTPAELELTIKLEEIDPTASPQALAAWSTAHAELLELVTGRAVADFRRYHIAWSELGVAFQISRQAAWERFKRFEEVEPS